MTLDQKQYETYEALILTEQMPAAEAVALMVENPHFEKWYRDRMIERLGERASPSRKNMLPAGVTTRRVFQTEDGETHDTVTQARYHVARENLCDSIRQWGIFQNNPDSTDVANAISDNADVVRQYLDASDDLQREINQMGK